MDESESDEEYPSGDEDCVPNANEEYSDAESVGSIEIEEEYSDDDSETDEEEEASTDIYFGKDGTQWQSSPLPHGQTAAHNIMRQKPGPARCTKDLTITETFKLIFTDEMLDIVLRQTNRKGKSVYDLANQKSNNQPGKS